MSNHETSTVNYLQVLPGGVCFAHGRYFAEKCPQWPKCATDPPDPKWVAEAMHQNLTWSHEEFESACRRAYAAGVAAERERWENIKDEIAAKAALRAHDSERQLAAKVVEAAKNFRAKSKSSVDFGLMARDPVPRAKLQAACDEIDAALAEWEKGVEGGK